MDMKKDGARRTLGPVEDSRRRPEDSESRIDDDEEEEERELEELEREINEMATKILKYRTTLPDQLSSTLSSIFSSQRLIFNESVSSDLDPGPSTPGEVEHSKAGLPMKEDPKFAKKVQLLKDKVSSNISAMPVVLKRMSVCISNIDKLESHHGIIHPVFKHKRLSEDFC